MSMEQEFIQFLRQRKGLHELFDRWVIQYEQKGELKGSVLLANTSLLQQEAIGAFLGKDVRMQDIRIYWKEMERAIQNSRFCDCDVVKVLTLWKGANLCVRKEERRKKQEAEKKRLADILRKTEGTWFPGWWAVIREKQPEYARSIKSYLLQEHDSFLLCVKAVSELPYLRKQWKPLAVFAAEISKDPHFFDNGMTQQLLYQGICHVLQETPSKVLQEKKAILEKAGILQDEASNFCMLCHISARQGGDVHAGWQGFFDRYEAWNVSLWNLSYITAIEQSVQIVYIVENPSVYRMLCAYGKKQQVKQAGFLCTNGQLNLCSYVLLDLIKEAGIAMYYSGDFDPEGLLIADKLKDRYGENLKLWHYDAKAYAFSRSAKQMSERRISMLARLRNEQLKEIGELLIKEKVCAYQEKLLPLYYEDMIRGMQER